MGMSVMVGALDFGMITVRAIMIFERSRFGSVTIFGSIAILGRSRIGRPQGSPQFVTVQNP